MQQSLALGMGGLLAELRPGARGAGPHRVSVGLQGRAFPTILTSLAPTACRRVSSRARLPELRVWGHSGVHEATVWVILPTLIATAGLRLLVAGSPTQLCFPAHSSGLQPSVRLRPRGQAAVWSQSPPPKGSTASVPGPTVQGVAKTRPQEGVPSPQGPVAQAEPQPAPSGPGGSWS